ncbi:MAG: acyltransferase [Lachnospiraceae bacterium]|nr:acyltransferase [Lachnospiraceae bacterium]
MQKVERLDYLNGLKVLAFLRVFRVHFLNIFYPGLYSLNPEVFHTQRGIERIVATTPLDIVIAGKFGVRLFFIMSGFLAARRFFMTGDEKALSEGAFKKYFRLVLPIAFVNLLVFLAMAAGLYHNQEAAVLGNSVDLFGNYNQFSPSLWGALGEAFWGCFLTGSNDYNGPLWFIQVEFLGTLMVAAILALWGKKRARFAAYAAACIFFIKTDDYLAVFLGLILAELFYHDYKWVEVLKKKKALMWIGLIGCLLLGTYPPIGEYGNLDGTIYGLIPPKVMIFYMIGGFGLLFTVSALEPVQKLLSCRLFGWLSKISYCFYLVHFPILCTVTSMLFIRLCGKLNYHLTALVCYLITFPIVLLISYVLHLFVEKPGIRLAGKLAGKLL